MRNLLLATSAVFLLTGSFAFAGGGSWGGGSSTTNTTTVMPIKNATSSGAGNSSATTGGSASSIIASLKNSNNQTNSDNFTLLSQRTDTKTDVKLATASNEGSVQGILTVNGTKTEDCGCDPQTASYKSGDNTMDNSVNGTGINTAQQNSGAFSLQQNSVALGSVITGGSGSVF
jgi:hypothetical protein